MTRDQASSLEVKLIKELDTRNTAKGYNISIGGDGFDSERSKSMWEDDEFKRIASKRMREAWKCPQKRK